MQKLFESQDLSMKIHCQKRCWHRLRGLALTSTPEEGEPWPTTCVGEDGDMHILQIRVYVGEDGGI